MNQLGFDQASSGELIQRASALITLQQYRLAGRVIRELENRAQAASEGSRRKVVAKLRADLDEAIRPLVKRERKLAKKRDAAGGVKASSQKVTLKPKPRNPNQPEPGFLAARPCSICGVMFSPKAGRGRVSACKKCGDNRGSSVFTVSGGLPELGGGRCR